MLLDWRGVAVVGVVLGIAVYVTRNQVAQAATEIGEAVNPVNPDNIFSQGANAITRSLSGDQDQTLGTFIYDYFHGGDV